MLANIIFSLLIGTLPYIDNLAHVGGFVFGIFAGLLFMPKIYYGKWDHRRKMFLSIISVPAIIFLVVVFLKSFYDSENLCSFCHYFNCIPGMPWCDQKFSTVQHVDIQQTGNMYHGF